METPAADIEDVTLSDILGLATWNRERSDEELRSFITSHEANLPDDTEVA